MSKANESFKPDFLIEDSLIAQGFGVIAGTDEAGRGPIAGPVVSAAVVLNPQDIPEGLNDSKKLSPKRREAMFDRIMSTALAVGVAEVSAGEIDRINIRRASLESMRLAVTRLAVQPHHVLVDGDSVPPGLEMAATAVIKGDARSLSIAAASIIAKVTRDRIMEQACRTWPGYGFSRHAGYGTAEHLAAIEALGPTPIHRMTFRPLCR